MNLRPLQFLRKSEVQGAIYVGLPSMIAGIHKWGAQCQRRLSHIFVVSGNSSIRVTSKPFSAKSAIFTKMWVRQLWHWALQISVHISKRNLR
jgi:hypothetical protein